MNWVSSKPTMVYMDNEPFLNAVTGDRGASNKSKYIMIRLHIIREAYMAGNVEFGHMHTANIPSDSLTKLLALMDKAGYIDGTKPLNLEGKSKNIKMD